MWLLRFGRERNWRTSAHAVKDLTPRAKDNGLSVYRVESREEGLQVCSIDTIVFQKSGPDDRFFVLIPESCLDTVGLQAVAMQYDNMPEFLKIRHCEIPKEALSEEALRNFAEEIFRIGPIKVDLSETQIRLIARDFADSPDIKPFVNEAWAAELASQDDSGE